MSRRFSAILLHRLQSTRSRLLSASAQPDPGPGGAEPLLP
jgi:hypothetical protein